MTDINIAIYYVDITKVRENTLAICYVKVIAKMESPRRRHMMLIELLIQSVLKKYLSIRIY